MKKTINGIEVDIRPKSDLSGFNLNKADFSGSDFRKSNFRGALGNDINFKNSNFSGSNFSESRFTRADFRECNLTECDFTGAILNGSNFLGSNLAGSNFTRACLYGCNFNIANLSQTTGLLSASEWLKKNFDMIETEIKTKKIKGRIKGYVVYKDVRSRFYQKPSNWKFKKGGVLTEVCNFNRTDDCACGISFATLDWVENHSANEIWKCLIPLEWLSDVCVPYNTDGKARCERLILLEKDSVILR